MQQVTPASHDPAPSRWAYRLQRWMLTPGIRLALRVGVPGILVFSLTSLFLASEERRDALIVFFAQMRASIEERPEFMVNVMAIDGAGRALDEDIREIVPIDFPVSSFDLDLEHIRTQITGLDPVKTASARIRPGGILQVDVVERTPVVIWRDRDGLSMLDETGAHIDELAARALRFDLPMIAGDGADTVVPEALALFAATTPIMPRVRALVRIGERRWDVVLDRQQRILLPEEEPVAALERVLALGTAQDLLARDLSVIDMRLGQRPTLRLTENAVEEWRRIRALTVNGQ